MQHDYTVYQGTPNDIIKRLMNEIMDALGEGGIPPSGIHILALMHLVAASWKLSRENPVQEEGVMPSFRTMLNAFVKTATDSNWSPEETALYKEDFTAIVRSLGGDAVTEGKGPLFMAKPSGMVH